MFYYTYILKSQKDEKLYIGSTSNLRERLKSHNQGEVDSTRSRRPDVLVYYEEGLIKEKAFKREKYFKTGFGRRFIKSRI